MKNNRGFGAVGLLLGVIIIGIIAATGWLVYNRNKTTTGTNNEQRANGQTISNTDDLPGGFVAYHNDELGLTFSYPKEWGVVTAKRYISDECAQTIKDANIDVMGEKYEFLFSANSEKRAYVITNDFEVLSGVLYCGALPVVPTNNSNNAAFMEDGNYSYVVQQATCSGDISEHALFGLANIGLEVADVVQIMLYQQEDSNNNTCDDDNQSDIAALKAMLTQQDKDFVTSFKKL